MKTILAFLLVMFLLQGCTSKPEKTPEEKLLNKFCEDQNGIYVRHMENLAGDIAGVKCIENDKFGVHYQCYCFIDNCNIHYSYVCDNWSYGVDEN